MNGSGTVHHFTCQSWHTCADTCPPAGEVANLPDIIYFRANATFPDSASITNADVASFAISAPSLAESSKCPCGVDAVKSQRSGSALGAVLTPDP